MDHPREIELVFAPQEEGGSHAYAPDLPGLHSQGDTLEEATANAKEALELYVDGLREDERSFDAGVIRRRFPIPASATLFRSSRASDSSRQWNEMAGRQTTR
jgi:predicted RNase H-like HicB family nuclease